MTRARTHRLANDQGGILVEWLFTLPLFMLVFFLIIQTAMIAAASLVVQYAAYAGARAAAVGLPEHTRENADHVCALILSAISPQARTTDRAGDRLGQTLRAQGSPWTYRHSGRRTAFAREAANIRVSPDEVTAGPENVVVEVEYPFELTIPFASAVYSPSFRHVAGINGRYITLRASATMRSTGSRVAAPLEAFGRFDP